MSVSWFWYKWVSTQRGYLTVINHCYSVCEFSAKWTIITPSWELQLWCTEPVYYLNHGILLESVLYFISHVCTCNSRFLSYAWVSHCEAIMKVCKLADTLDISSQNMLVCRQPSFTCCLSSADSWSNHSSYSKCITMCTHYYVRVAWWKWVCLVSHASLRWYSGGAASYSIVKSSLDSSRNLYDRKSRQSLV